MSSQDSLLLGRPINLCPFVFFVLQVFDASAVSNASNAWLFSRQQYLGLVWAYNCVQNFKPFPGLALDLMFVSDLETFTGQSYLLHPLRMPVLRIPGGS